MHNAITNGGNEPNLWRTLTCDEWWYLFGGRTTVSGKLFAWAVVNGINGLILLPDNWNESYYALDYSWSYDCNRINASQWNELEQYGAIFLPAAHYRNKNRVAITDEEFNNYGCGCYWSSTREDVAAAWSVGFYPEEIFMFNEPSERYYGFSVRLVCPVP